MFFLETQTNTANIGIDEHGIIHIKYFENITIKYVDAVDIFSVVRELTHDEPSPWLIDIRHRVTMDEKAMRFVTDQDIYGHVIARGIILDRTTRRKTFNFFNENNPRKIPTNFFVKEQGAIDWLIALKNIEQ